MPWPAKWQRNASTEFAGAVRIEKDVEVQKDGDVGVDKDEEEPGPDSHKADDEDEDLFDQPEFSQMNAEIRKRVKEVYKKLRATIKEIPGSLQERGEIVVETAVSNDGRPESFLAAHDSTRIRHDKQGIRYIEKGADSSLSLFHAVGPPLEAISMPLPEAFPSRLGFQWVAIDDCWTLPKPGLARVPLSRGAFKSTAPWEVASRVLNKTPRYGGDQIRY